MSKRLRFFKLRKSEKSGTASKSEVISAKQPTISKFFAPQNSNKRGNNEAEGESDAGQPTIKRLRTEAEVVSVAQTLSAATKRRITEFTFTSEREDEPQKHQKYADHNSSKCAVNKPCMSDADTQPRSSKYPAARKATSSKPLTNGKMNYTPLEKQYLEIKEKYPDAILFIECGYKFRFFGRDAEIAADELKIYAHIDHNFMTCSIPTHRLHVHANRLVSKGHKVGVVKQTETAAMKAHGDNRNAPFTRKLTALYTKATLLGEDVELEAGTAAAEQCGTSYMMCLYETEEKGIVTIAFVAIQLGSGDCIYDCFMDNRARSELETRLAHIQPVEILMPRSGISSLTHDRVQDVIKQHAFKGDGIRTEHVEERNYDYSAGMNMLSKFYSGCEGGETMLQHLISLPPPVLCCTSALVSHLKEFNLEKAVLFNELVHFTSKANNMHLNGITVHNLELFNNTSNGKVKGSLFWILNHTLTGFGARLLRQWISHPLCDIEKICERQHAVDELLASNSPLFALIRERMSRMPDLEKCLHTVMHQRCTTWDFYKLCSCLSQFRKTVTAFARTPDTKFESRILMNCMEGILTGLDDIDTYLDNMREGMAKEGNKTQLFVDVSKFPDVVKCMSDIDDVIEQLQNLRESIRSTLRLPGFAYTTVNGQEYLIEVKNAQLKGVPSSWSKISCTKQCARFRSPEVEKLFGELCRKREELDIHSHHAWLSVLSDFSKNYICYRSVVRHIATLDVLYSFAHVAKGNGYCKPTMVSGPAQIKISHGRHPIVSQLIGSDGQFVPNDTDLSSEGQCCTIITGPNMGGKSCYIRQVALIAIMAQIGSYVPAESATLSVLDAVYTRMGAQDEIYSGRSTFMVELAEASEIMCGATANSLVILDELGRGTATHDGTAIAFATLDHFVKNIKSLVLFVTHYTSIAELELLYKGRVVNYHMGYVVRDGSNNDVTFLYKLTEGVAGSSFGLNIARMVDLPLSVLELADSKSEILKTMITDISVMKKTFRQLWTAPAEEISTVVARLTDL